MDKEPIFLSLDDVLAIHANQLEVYGGSSGIRDGDALLSALEAPVRVVTDSDGDVMARFEYGIWGSSASVKASDRGGFVLNRILFGQGR